MIGYLTRLALAESPSADPGSQAAVLAILGDSLASSGFRVRLLQDRRGAGHLYARPDMRERGVPAQLLLGHCDTVWPIGTVKEMPVEATGGVVRGPGVYDMKGGLAQMIFALQTLGELGLKPEATPLVFVNSDEEMGSRESGRHIRRLARVVERTFVLEPSLGPEGRLKTARKGVGRFSVVVEGKAAHAGLDPDGGASAILELSYVVQALFALNEPQRGITVNVGTIDGGLSPNVIAPRCTAEVDVRVPTREDARRVEAEILSLQPVTPGVKLTVSGGMGRPPMERTPRNRRLWEAARRLGTELGLDLEEGTAGGGSDGSTTSLYTATLDGLGAVGDGAHARHEFVYADALVERTALLALLLLEPVHDRRERSGT
ncbi:MAG: M20 family metallopeptidase [Actinomycetota bacterium]